MMMTDEAEIIRQIHGMPDQRTFWFLATTYDARLADGTFDCVKAVFAGRTVVFIRMAK